MELQDGDVLRPVVADHAGRVGLAVPDIGHADAGGPIDHVVVGQDLSRGREDDTRSGGLFLGIAERRVDVHQARVHFVRDGRDVARARTARRTRPDDPEPDEPEPENPNPTNPNPTNRTRKPDPPEPPDGLVLGAADEEAGVELPVQATWPMPTPAASATTAAAAPMMAPMCFRPPCEGCAGGSAEGVQAEYGGLGGAP